MPFTQGREWQFGDRAEKNPDYKVKVTRLEKTTEDGLVDNETLKKKILSYQGKEAGDTQLKNDVTGWVLSISKRDADEIVHGISARREDAPRRVQESIVDTLVEIVRKAFPAESYHDIKASQGAKGKDVNLKGVHRFYSPVSVGGEGYLVKITVKDRTGYRGKNNGLNNQDRLEVYQVVGMEITKAQRDSKPLKNSDNEGQVAAEGSRNQSLERPSQQTAFSEDEITVREMLSGVKRDGDVIYVKKTGADGKEYWAKDETRRTRFFTEEPNQWAYEEKGGYWMDPNDQSGDLLQMKGGVFSKEESDVQADINSRAVMSLARANGIAPDQIDSFAAKITWSKDSKSLSVPGEYAMPFTQGREWQFGDRAERNPDYKVKVVRLEKENAPIPNNQGLAELIESYRGENGVRLENDTTGWRFSISSNDKNEIIHAIANRESGTPGRMAMVSVLKNLPAVVKNAFPAESYRDIKAPQGVRGVDESLKGVHRFYSPVVVGDGEYLVKITVKDRASDGGKKSKDRLSAYQIVGIETEKAQPMSEPLLSDGVPVKSSDGDRSRTVEVMSVPRYASDEITVREMLSGVKRDGDVIYVKKTGADGKEYWAKDETRRTRFFTEEPNQWAYEEKGGYWKDPNDQSGDLLQMNGGVFSKEESDVQADINSRAVMSLARANGIAPDQIDSFAAKITWSKDSKSLSVPGEYAMPFTQGKEWHMGSHAIGKENEQVRVVHMDPVQESSRKGAIETLTEKLATGVRNNDSGWILAGSKSDVKKSLPPFKFSEENAGLYDAIVKNFEKVLSDAKLIESHVDIQHKNNQVRGIHRFATATTYEGKNYRVQLLVRDYAPSAGGERLATHTIDAVEVEEIRTAGGEGVIAPLAPAATTNVPLGAMQSSGAGVSKAWSSADSISLSDLLSGYVREDKRGPFDPVDDSSRADGGVYFEPNDLFQILKVKLGSPKAASELLREHGVLGVRYYGAIDGECAVVWDEVSIKILHELEQAMGRDGSIRGAFQTGNNTIRLTPNANLSTFSSALISSVFLGFFQVKQNGPSPSIFQERFQKNGTLKGASFFTKVSLVSFFSTILPREHQRRLRQSAWRTGEIVSLGENLCQRV